MWIPWDTLKIVFLNKHFIRLSHFLRVRDNDISREGHAYDQDCVPEKGVEWSQAVTVSKISGPSVVLIIFQSFSENDIITYPPKKRESD